MNTKIIDSIYGEFELEPVLIELINSDVIQRLKGVHQGGASYLVNKNWNLTRYDHSIGTMLLIKLLGASINEQIAGLLHDISHTAFSHAIDFALENNKEDYHEVIFNEVVENSQIPNILSKYGYDYKEILEDESKWTILEQSAPKLCADRIDYTLRDMYHYGYTSKDEVSLFIENIKVVNGEIVVTDIEIAKYFVELYYKEVIDFFMNPLNIYGNDILSKLLRLGIDTKIINMKDLLKTDKEVMDILKYSNNKEIQDLIKSLSKNMKLKVNESKYDLYQKGKVRLIDPTVYIDGKLSKISEIDDNISKINKQAYEKMSKGIYIEICQ